MVLQNIVAFRNLKELDEGFPYQGTSPTALAAETLVLGDISHRNITVSSAKGDVGCQIASELNTICLSLVQTREKISCSAILR
jgi:hypothetical protein